MQVATKEINVKCLSVFIKELQNKFNKQNYMWKKKKFAEAEGTSFDFLIHSIF